VLTENLVSNGFGIGEFKAERQRLAQGDYFGLKRSIRSLECVARIATETVLPENVMSD